MNDEFKYEVKVMDNDKEWAESLSLAYAEGLSASIRTVPMSDVELATRAQNFIKGMIIFNEELSKEVERNDNS